MSEEDLSSLDWAEHKVLWLASRDELLEMATEARTHARHYNPNGTRAGAAALVWGPECGYQRITGYNSKQAAGPRQEHDHCAERMVLGLAKEAGATLIIGMVVVASFQPDDETGLDLGVTICCKYCRTDFVMSFAEAGLYMRDTEFLFVNPATDVRLSLTAADILGYCINHPRH